MFFPSVIPGSWVTVMNEPTEEPRDGFFVRTYDLSTAQNVTKLVPEGGAGVGMHVTLLSAH